MKCILFILLSFFIVESSAQNKKPTNPPGTIQLRENLFIDADEVSNFDYREYLLWLRQVFGEKSDRYIRALPDAKMCPDYYFKNPEAANYPMVGITYEQAVSYCKWRTDRVFERDLALKKIVEVDPDQNRDNYFSVDNIKNGRHKIGRINDLMKMQITIFRLPSEEEWELAAAGGLDPNIYPYGIKDTMRIKLKLIVERSLEDDIIKTSSYKRSTPNGLKISNMIGNVAEMMREKGLAKGGSWKDKLEDCKIQAEAKYEKSANWLGFRCIAETKPFQQ
jgi:formylglycine-generating enzyme required for sulfatase activity